MFRAGLVPLLHPLHRVLRLTENHIQDSIRDKVLMFPRKCKHGLREQVVYHQITCLFSASLNIHFINFLEWWPFSQFGKPMLPFGFCFFASLLFPNIFPMFCQPNWPLLCLGVHFQSVKFPVKTIFLNPSKQIEKQHISIFPHSFLKYKNI